METKPDRGRGPSCDACPDCGVDLRNRPREQGRCHECARRWRAGELDRLAGQAEKRNALFPPQTGRTVIVSENNGTARPSLKQLAALLAEANPADVAELDREISQAEGTVQRLKALRKILGGKARPAVPAARTNGHTKGWPPGQPGPEPGRAHPATTERRKKLAAHMRLNGHMRPSEIGRMLGIADNTVYNVVRCGWFEREGDGRWSLTAEGRTAIEQRETVPPQDEEEDE